MSERIEQGDEDFDLDGEPFRYIPKTTIGKILLGVYLIAFIAIALSVTGFVFAEPELVGPLPAAAAWTFGWYTVIFGVVVATYVFLFKPWADSAQHLREEERVETDDQEGAESTPGDVLTEEND
jgi:hypothetical protein